MPFDTKGLQWGPQNGVMRTPNLDLRQVRRLTSHGRRAGLLASCCVIPVLTPFASAAGSDARAPVLSARAFSATSGSAPFAGDYRLLTTISPNGDGLRDEATIHFTLSEPAATRLEIRRTRPAGLVFSRTMRLHAGRNALTWSPTAAGPGTYLVRLVLADAAGSRRTYDVEQTRGARSRGTPVVRVLGIDASFTRESSAPGRVTSLEISTDVPSLTLEFFRSGPGVQNMIAVTEPLALGWRTHLNRRARMRVRVGNWPTGVYYVQLTADDGQVGYAPLIVRPARLGRNRVAVVLPTNTWQAYNFWDEDGDGVGDTWYAGCPTCTVRLDRPYLGRGEPPHFQDYDLPFLHWLAWGKRPVDYLAESDLEAVPNGAALARAYDLIIFPGHHEYVTTHEYNVVVGYRNLGGNLIFLSANNFYWRVERRGRLLRRTAKWRQLGRPEAGLIGVQYRASDRGQRKGSFVVRNTAAAPWFFKGTNLVVGSRLTGFGVEIDATAASSPRRTRILAEIPNFFGPRVTAQMTYYETRAGAKVFAAGAFTLARTWEPGNTLLNNLWAHLEKP